MCKNFWFLLSERIYEYRMLNGMEKENKLVSFPLEAPFPTRCCLWKRRGEEKKEEEEEEERRGNEKRNFCTLYTVLNGFESEVMFHFDIYQTICTCHIE